MVPGRRHMMLWWCQLVPGKTQMGPERCKFVAGIFHMGSGRYQMVSGRCNMLPGVTWCHEGFQWCQECIKWCQEDVTFSKEGIRNLKLFVSWFPLDIKVYPHCGQFLHCSEFCRRNIDVLSTIFALINLYGKCEATTVWQEWHSSTLYLRSTVVKLSLDLWFNISQWDRKYYQIFINIWWGFNSEQALEKGYKTLNFPSTLSSV